jgi:hypothetical protein
MGYNYGKIKGGIMMKKIAIGMMLMFASVILGACGIAQDVKNATTYLPEVTKYVANVTLFANEAPIMAQQAILDETKRVEFEEKLKEIKSEMEKVNGLTPPSQLEELHQQLVTVNTTAEKGIDQYLNAIQNGKLNEEFINQTPLVKNVKEITSIFDEMKNVTE